MPRPDRSRPVGQEVPQNLIPALLVTLLVLVFTGAAWGQTRPNGTTDIDVRIGAGYSENIRRTQGSQQSSSYNLIGLSFDYLRDGARVDTDFLGNIERRNYSLGNLSSEPVGSINASVDADIVPNIFSWFVRDNYSQGRTNVFRAVGPGNRQQINVFSTGPRLQAPLGSRTFLRATATRSESDFSNSKALDADRKLYDIGFYRVLSSTTEIGIGMEHTETEFEDTPVDSEIDTYFLSYDRQLARGSANARIGETESGFAGITNKSPVYQVGWNRQVGARSRVAVNAQHGITDYTGVFLRSVAATIVGPAPSDLILIRNTYESTSLSLNYTLNLERSDLSLGLSAGESQYVSVASSFTSDDQTLTFSANRTIRPQLQLRFNARGFKRTYTVTGTDQTVVLASMALAKQFGRRFDLDFSVIRELQSGTTGFNFDENSARLAFNVDLDP